MILLSMAAWSMGASAFMVLPQLLPTISHENEAYNLHSIEAHVAHSQQIDLPCSRCPFPEISADGEVNWIEEVDTTLSLAFTTDGENLLVNDHQILPPPTSQAPWNINAVQRRASDGLETTPITLGFAFELVPMESSRHSEWLARFTVLDLAGHPVPVDTIAIGLAKLDGQGLLIVGTRIEHSDADPLSWKQCGGKPSCLKRLIIARIQALIASAKARVMRPFAKGCHRRPRPDTPAIHGSSISNEADVPPRHHRHHHHRYRHGWQRTFSRVVRFIFLPAVLGVLAGLAASAIGMLVGQVAVFLWLRYRRGGSHHAIPSPVDMEKEALMTDAIKEELPPYRDEELGVIRLLADKK